MIIHLLSRCLASCVAVTVTIALILQGKYNPNDSNDLSSLIDEGFQHAQCELATEEEKKELETYMKRPDLSLLHLDEHSKIGYTYKTMGAGFYALIHGTNFEEMITQITMEGGDSDTNCAVAGAMLG